MKVRGVDGDFIEKVKQANNIVAVAGRYMNLKPKGKTQWACCPFHHEKTPSFAINEMQQFYHCFGCGVSGDVISLVQQLESVSFYDALGILAKSAGLEMPAASMDENYARNAKKKERVLLALSEVKDFYCANLSGEYLQYLRDRGISDDLIKLFSIGACLDWNSSITHLKSKGFSEQEIIDAGIGVRGERGNIYDAMGQRVTFAISNIYGDCIGFTGRTLSADKEIAKYRNTAQTIVFDKGSIVYGVDVLKKNKLSNFVDKLIVVEGNVDVISLVGAGFTSTVACMGTALTAFHAKIFARFADQVYICFDGDSAGQSAALRGLDILATENLSVRVVSIPDGLDPDDYVKKFGKTGFEKLLEEAMPLVDYKLWQLERRSNLKDSLGKTKYLEEAVAILQGFAGTPQLELYIPRVAGAAGVSFDSVVRAVERSTRGGQVVAPFVKDAGGRSDEEFSLAPVNSAYSRALDFVVASVLHAKDYADISKLSGFRITNRLYNSLVQKIGQRADWKVSFIFDLFEDEELKQLEPLISFSFEIEKQALEKYWKDCIMYLSRHDLQKQIDEIKEKYKATDDAEERMRLMKEIQRISKELKSQNGTKG